MTVPITSDLPGYAAFWTHAAGYAVVGAVILLTPIYTLLWLI